MRHAIYFAPIPGTIFHELGSRWLGRDAFTDEPCEQPQVDGIGVVTGDPRRYGFHATLKPPFALRDMVTPEALLRAARRPRVASGAVVRHQDDGRLRVRRARVP